MTGPIIRVDGLTKQFGGIVAVDHVSFDIPKGRHTGIIGPNGSGKTTLFNLITGFYPVTSGKVFFLDTEITNYPIHKRTKLGLGRTFQLVSVFDSLKVWENMVLGIAKANGNFSNVLKFYLSSRSSASLKEKCMEHLRIVGLYEKSEYYTSNLSYGDKRLLEIAVSLALDPFVIMLDEPFAGLSDYEIGIVSDILLNIREKNTLIIIEHKLTKLINLIDHLIVLNEGQLICQGTPSTVLNDEQVRACYWGNK